MADPARRRPAVREAACAIRHRLCAHRRRLRRCGAARLQGSGRRGSLSEGTARSLPTRRAHYESACARDAANQRDGWSLAARSRTAALAALANWRHDMNATLSSLRVAVFTPEQSLTPFTCVLDFSGEAICAYCGEEDCPGRIENETWQQWQCRCCRS